MTAEVSADAEVVMEKVAEISAAENAVKVAAVIRAEKIADRAKIAPQTLGVVPLVDLVLHAHRQELPIPMEQSR
jgi:hypothetical protein